MDTLVHPTFRGLRKAGIHLREGRSLAALPQDCLHHNLDYCKAHGVTADEMYRKYLGAIREDLEPRHLPALLLGCPA